MLKSGGCFDLCDAVDLVIGLLGLRVVGGELLHGSVVELVPQRNVVL